MVAGPAGKMKSMLASGIGASGNSRNGVMEDELKTGSTKKRERERLDELSY